MFNELEDREDSPEGNPSGLDGGRMLLLKAWCDEGGESPPNIILCGLAPRRPLLKPPPRCVPNPNASLLPKPPKALRVSWPNEFMLWLLLLLLRKFPVNDVVVVEDNALLRV